LNHCLIKILTTKVICDFLEAVLRRLPEQQLKDRVIDNSGTAQLPDGIFDSRAVMLTREPEPGGTPRANSSVSHSAWDNKQRFTHP
jgi:hypothetical protein